MATASTSANGPSNGSTKNGRPSADSSKSRPSDGSSKSGPPQLFLPIAPPDFPPVPRERHSDGSSTSPDLSAFEDLSPFAAQSAELLLRLERCSQSAASSCTTSSPAVFQAIRNRVAAHLRWENVNYSVKVGKGRRELLKGVSGDLKPGSLTCILGPSGAGKTTLLNILSGRVGSGGRFAGQLDGDFTLNGQSIAPTSKQSLFAYVMQEDALFATETPKEVLTMSAYLRLHGVQDQEIQGLVEDMISSLGLTDCQHTFCGNAMLKGLSGGQRKRTAIGAELITNPSITFLDEPTSGLDSNAAYNVIEVLQALTRSNQAVLCTIHQPSSEVFHKFDNAIFLVKGSVVYQGPPSKIREYFNTLELVCPQDYNPADFVMFVIERSNEEQLSLLSSSWKKEYTSERLKERQKERRSRERQWDTPKEKVGATGSLQADQADNFAPRRGHTGIFLQMKMLAARNARNLVRDKACLIARFVITCALATVLSCIFWQVGDTNASDYTVQSHTGALTFAAMNVMMVTVQPTLLTFPYERPVFLREKFAGMYSAAAYMLSKTVVEVFLVAVQCSLAVLIYYWALGLHGDFFRIVIDFMFLGLACSSLGLLVGCAVTDVHTAMEMIPVLFVPQYLFTGFFIRIEQIPVALRWIQYICCLKWGISALLSTEIGGNDDVVGPRAGWSDLLEENDIDEELYGVYLAILLGIFVLCRVLGAVLLHRKAKTLYA